MNRSHGSRIPFAVAALSLGVSFAALAQPHRRPPPEAYAACEAKQQSDKCAVQLPDRSVDGVCQADAEQKLFCRPDRPPHRGPPPEAFAACDAKKAGEACAVELRDGQASGVCRAAHDQRLFCLPDRGPRGEAPPPPPEQ